MIRDSGFPDDEFTSSKRSRDASKKGSSSIAVSSNEKLSHVIPEEYLYDPLAAEPTLDHLRSMASNLVIQAEQEDRKVEKRTNALLTSLPSSPVRRNSMMEDKGEDGKEEAGKILRDLLRAADKDVSIHMARVKAVLAQDPSILKSFSFETDKELQQRSQRLTSLQEQRKGLATEALKILQNLNENMDQQDDATTETTGNVTETMSSPSKKSLQTRLSAWRKALQLYIFTPPDHHITTAETGDPSKSTTSFQRSSQSDLTLLQLLQNLCVLCKPEEEEGDEMTLLSVLEQAKQVCSTHMNKCQSHLQDAMEQTIEIQQKYHVHLIAHSISAQRTLHQTSNVQKQFLHFGKEALKIGRALETAESRRRQCDYAQKLIRRFWFMENLAEQEELSGEYIQVGDEVRNVIAPASCKMDELFTRKEFSLEASKTLNGLRMIIKCRSTVSASGTSENATDTTPKSTITPSSKRAGNPPTIDPQAQRRFDLTSNLIERTSTALEQRLLNDFSQIYTSSGTYDFSSVQAAKRHGRLDWVELRNISESLMFFDHGKALQELYINLVVSTKIPELFHKDDFEIEDEDESDDDVNQNDETTSTLEEKEADFDIDATRTKLSTLFHRVCEVCTEEFQLIAHVFSPTLPHHLIVDLPSSSGRGLGQSSSFTEAYPMNVARLLLQRIINNPQNGMQAQINDLLESIDRRGDFDAGSKKLDVFVVLHEKAAALFELLKEAAQKMWGTSAFSPAAGTLKDQSGNDALASFTSNSQAVNSLIQFLTSQEIALSSSHRRGYLNLELRLLHHQCCANLDRAGAKLIKQARGREGNRMNSTPGAIPEFRAPIMTLDKAYIKNIGFKGLLSGVLKQSTLRQPLIHAIDSLARARLMYGVGSGGGEDVDSTARVILTMFTQMINFIGYSYLFPIIESLGSMLQSVPPSSPPLLPFDENAEPHNLGVDGDFWISIERIYSFCKSFDRELWAENRAGSNRTWSILVSTRSQTSLTLAKDRRMNFFQNLEERGESVILRALDAISSHIQWILVAGGESASTSGSTTRILQNFTNQGGGPYAVPNGSLLDSTNSPSVKAITFCLRSQFVHIQSALTPQSLSAFWTALSMRLHDILVARLLQHYTVSTVGAVVLSRDVEALRSVAMLAGTMHSHWDNLRELLTLYMTPPDALKTMLVGPDGDVNSGKGMFGRVGKDQSIVFTSRRVDYRYNTKHGYKKSPWVIELLEDLGVNDPTDGRLNLSIYAAENMIEK